MASRADTLKLARVDLEEAKTFLSRADDALRGHTIYGRTCTTQVRFATQTLDKVSRRLRRAFNIEVGESS